MQRIWTVALVLLVGLSLSFEADARRFGGGRSFGSAPIHQPRQSAPSAPAAAPAGAGRPAAAGGASRWLGPLAGIAAGGLLASMFLGGGFHGIQLFDILIIGVLGFIAFRIFAARRAPPAIAGAAERGAPGTIADTPAGQFTSGDVSLMPRPPISAPAWFDEDRFVATARGHFLALQQHWDANEMDKISEFVTPTMLQFLAQERGEAGEGLQSTYINNLSVQLDGLDDRPDKTIATLTFNGVSKTSRFDTGETFSESWNMERAPGANQPWLVAGIRQNI